jgi:hypothetical protein
MTDFRSAGMPTLAPFLVSGSGSNYQNFRMELPPSASSADPVTKLEASEARNKAALAISSGAAWRPSAWMAFTLAIASASLPN